MTVAGSDIDLYSIQLPRVRKCCQRHATFSVAYRVVYR